MLKLYKTVDGVLRYHEAWANQGIVYEHWGVVGDRGDLKEHSLPKRADCENAVLEVLRPAAEAGFRPITMDAHTTLLIEYSVDGFGAKHDLAKRHSLENRMNDTLGWTALGACDGGSAGSGTMEVCCLVVDFDIAKRVITSDLQGTEFSDFTRIYKDEP
jgi:hypothetical protein